jgi:hypothetical protein
MFVARVVMMLTPQSVSITGTQGMSSRERLLPGEPLAGALEARHQVLDPPRRHHDPVVARARGVIHPVEHDEQGGAQYYEVEQRLTQNLA